MRAIAQLSLQHTILNDNITILYAIEHAHGTLAMSTGFSKNAYNMASDVTPHPPTTKLPLRQPEDCLILVVDDDLRILDALQQILSQDKYQVITAQTGAAALQLVDSAKPDVIILDVRLPEIDGIEVCRQIKTSASTQFLPVILVTGTAARRAKLDGLQAGADDFLNKPIDPLELTARVRSSLRSKQLTDAVEEQNQILERRVEERTQELRQAYEQLKQLNEVKGNILAIVSHELRTPLHQAKQALNLAQKNNIPQHQVDELLETVHRCFRLLEYRIGNIDAFSDPSALKIDAVSVSELIQRAINEATRLQQYPEQVVIQANVPSNLAPVDADNISISRAITHLLDNAIKFGADRPVTVEAEEMGEGVRISVKDQGDGIDPKVLPTLFEPLNQGDISSTRRYQGLGIGLALVRMILDAHNSKLQIDTSRKHGTTVSFVLEYANL